MFDKIIAMCDNAAKNLDILFAKNDDYRRGYENSVKHFGKNIEKQKNEYATEIKQLYETLDFRSEKISELESEIKSLKEENKKQRLIVESIDDNMFPLPFETDYDKAIKTAKAEAIKEFAEKLKVYFNPDNSCDIRKYIDDLVKETEDEINGK